jgi:hypothetical protein
MHEADAGHRAACAWLARGGNLLNAERLQPGAAAITIRMHEGKASFTGGPVAAVTEQLGGVYLIEARDLNEALRLATRIPVAPCRALEVRPVAAGHGNDIFLNGDVDFRDRGSTSR